MMLAINWMITAIVLLSIEVLLLIAWVAHFFKITYRDVLTGLPLVLPKGLEPEREMLLFLGWLVSVAFLAVIGWLCHRRYHQHSDYLKSIQHFVLVESISLFLIGFGVFKLIVYRYPFYNFLNEDHGQWVVFYLGVAAMISLLAKLFFIEINQFLLKEQSFKPLPVYLSHALGLMFTLALTAFFFPMSLWLKQGLINVGSVVLVLMLTRSWLISLGILVLLIKMWAFSYATLILPGALIERIRGIEGLVLVSLGCCWYVSYRRTFSQWLMTMLVLGAVVFVTMQPLLGALPGQSLFFGLRVRQFFPYIFGLVCHIFYALMVLYGINQHQHNGHKHQARVLISAGVFGLITHLFYWQLSAIDSYALFFLPAGVLIAWIVSQTIKTYLTRWEFVLGWGWLLGHMLFLCTNRLCVNHIVRLLG